MSLRQHVLIILLLLSALACDKDDSNPLVITFDRPFDDEFVWYDADEDINDLASIRSRGDRVTSNRGKGKSVLFFGETDIDSIVIGARWEEFNNENRPNMYFVNMLSIPKRPSSVTLYDGHREGEKFEVKSERFRSYGWSISPQLWGFEVCVQNVSGSPGDYIGIAIGFD